VSSLQGLTALIPVSAEQEARGAPEPRCRRRGEEKNLTINGARTPTRSHLAIPTVLPRLPSEDELKKTGNTKGGGYAQSQTRSLTFDYYRAAQSLHGEDTMGVVVKFAGSMFLLLGRAATELLTTRML
jgi:hypothetical protein